jgi:hypothetical protein
LVVLLLAAMLAVTGLAMVIASSGFGRFAHEVKISMPSSTPSTQRVTRAMGLVVLAAAVVVLLAWG